MSPPGANFHDGLGLVLRARADFPHSRYTVPNLDAREELYEVSGYQCRVTRARLCVGPRFRPFIISNMIDCM